MWYINRPRQTLLFSIGRKINLNKVSLVLVSWDNIQSTESVIIIIIIIGLKCHSDSKVARSHAKIAEYFFNNFRNIPDKISCLKIQKCTNLGIWNILQWNP